jgi:hypothetical protein
MTDTCPLELDVPAEAEYVGAARLFLAAVGRHFELDGELVADLKVAVSEVCAGAAEDLHAQGSMRISVRPGGEAIEIQVAPAAQIDPQPAVDGAAPGARGPGPTWGASLREPLVRALFPDAAYQASAHTLLIRIPHTGVNGYSP